MRRAPCRSSPRRSDVPLVGIACRVMAGERLAEIGFVREPRAPAIFVKAPVFPFKRFPGVDPLLGPEMKSTGEVMGVDEEFGWAFAKAWIAAGNQLPLAGTAFLSVHDREKPGLVPIAERLIGLGFEIVSTDGTARYPGWPRIHRAPDQQGSRGAAACRRRHDQSRHPARRQHSGRARLGDRRRLHPAHGGALPGAVHHDALGRPGGGRRHRCAEAGRAGGALAPGVGRPRPGAALGCLSGDLCLLPVRAG